MTPGQQLPEQQYENRQGHIATGVMISSEDASLTRFCLFTKDDEK